MRLFLAIVLTVFLAFGSGYASGQKRNSNTVRQERAAAGKKIDKTRRQIKTNIEDTRRQLARLTLLEGRIAEQNSRISLLKKRADSLSHISQLMADSVAATEARVELLKQSYASALRTIRRQRQATSATAFIFSSKSVNEAYSRIRYMRELGKWQTEKAHALELEAKRLDEARTRLDAARATLDTTIANLEQERAELQENMTMANDLLASLKSQGDNLNRILNQQQELARKLDSELERVIEEEMRRAEEEARQKAAREAERKKQEEAKNKDKKKDKKEDRKPSSSEKPAKQPAATPPARSAGDFAAQKGKLPSPVDVAATITGTFGRHTHSQLSKVEMVNNGIDFEATTGASARAVFPGVVSMIIVMDGYHNVVLVRHGEYLTVYAGIDELAVRKGQEVEAGQTLGKLYSDPSDGYRTRLHFEVRREKEKLNPAEWLR